MTIDFGCVFESAPVPLLVFDADDFRILAANEAFLDVGHLRREDIIGKCFEEAFPVDPADPDSFDNLRELRNSLDQVKESGKPSRVPLQRYTIPARDGSRGEFEEHFWSISDSPMCDERGRTRYIVHRVEDVTDLVRDGDGDGQDLVNEERHLRIARAGRKTEKVLRHANLIRRKNEHLRIAQRVANVGSWRLNLRDETRDWSDEMYRITGLDRHAPPTTESILRIVHPDDLEYFQRERASVRAGKNLPGEFEHRIIRPDNGHVCWVRERVEITYDDKGQPAWLYGTLQDITTYREAEEKVRESDERFRMVAKATADTIWDWNPSTGRIWWNEGIRTVFGYDADNRDWPTEMFGERIHPEDRERVRETALRAFEEGAEQWSCEYRFQRADGRYAIVYITGHIMRDAKGEAVRMVGALNDITQERERETQLAEQAELLDKAQDSIIVSDVDLDITYWNRSAERHYGWKAEEMTGRNKAMLEVNTDEFNAAIEQVLARGEWSGQLEQRRKDGSTFTVESSMSLVTDKAGNPKRILCVNTDITNRLALEDQLRQAQRLEAVGQLTGGVAHDFNNLLTVILGNAELIIDRAGHDKTLRILAAMTRDAASRGAELTHGLLAFARRQPLEPRTVDVNELVNSMQGLLARAVPEDIDIHYAAGRELWEAFVDPAQLESVVLNLALNAKDAMPNGGSLTIETANVSLDDDYAAKNANVAPGDYVLIAISDTGSGIPPEVIDRVFDPFFTTKAQGKGTGLGLSMAYGFAHQSGGNIRIYSEPGHGTTVRVYLPRSRYVEEAASATDLAAPEQGGGERVLVVEDDALVRAHAESQLEAFGYTVLSAEDGPTALKILEQEQEIDLLFTDVVMSGGMNGPQLVEMAKRIRPKLKILYTSGYTENAIVHHGRLDSGVHLLQKPYRREELARKVRDALSD